MSSSDFTIEEETGDIILYHGTSDYYLDDIKKDGLSGSYPDVELLILIQKYLPIFLEYKKLVSLHTENQINLNITGAFIEQFVKRQEQKHKYEYFFTKSLEVAYAFSGVNTTIGEGPTQFLKIFDYLIFSQNKFVENIFKKRDNEGNEFTTNYYFSFAVFIEVVLNTITQIPKNLDFTYFNNNYNDYIFNFVNSKDLDLGTILTEMLKTDNFETIIEKFYNSFYNMHIPHVLPHIQDFTNLEQKIKQEYIKYIRQLIIHDFVILQKKYKKMNESKGIILAYKFNMFNYKNLLATKTFMGSAEFTIKNKYPYEVVFVDNFYPEELYICVNCKDIIPQEINDRIKKNNDSQNYPTTEEFRERENSYRNRVNLLPLKQIGKKIIKIKSNISGRIYIR